MKRRAADKLDAPGVDLDRVGFLKAKTDRVWTRDSGPTFVVKQTPTRRTRRLALVDWEFNAWAKYDNHRRRRPDPPKLAKIARAEAVRTRSPTRSTARVVRVVLEGGSIDVNGKGTLLDHRGMPPERRPGAQPRPQPRRRSRKFWPITWASRTSSGSTRGSRATTPTATLTTSPGSSTQRRSPSSSSRTRTTRTTSRSRRTSSASRPPATRTATPLQVVDLPMPEPVVFEGRDCRRAMPISTSPTAWSWCRPSTTRPTARPSPRSPPLPRPRSHRHPRR